MSRKRRRMNKTIVLVGAELYKLFTEIMNEEINENKNENIKLNTKYHKVVDKYNNYISLKDNSTIK